MGPTLLLLVVIAATLAQGQRSSLNDFQRSKAMLLGDFVDNMKTVNDKLSVSVEECATRCNSIMDCRSFNYNWKTLACQMLPSTQHSTNMPLKRNVHYDLYQKKDYVRSCIIGIGENYRGTVSTTEKGKTCQHWGVSHPHDHRYFPNAKNGLEENYCRNPNKDAGGPWCYTTDYAVRHEFCGIKQCEEAVCYMCIGDDYRGFVDRTESGRECQRWDLQTPHKHPFHPDKYPDKNLNDNYCRNPDYSERPWCYTTDPSVQREYCKIQKCKKQGPQNVEITSSCFKGKGEGYRGRANLTSSGIPCQRWDSQTPQSHHFLPEKYGCKGLQENYCRNPDGSEAPWCFTTLPGMRVAFCFQIKRCVDEVPADGSVCYHGHGELYRGTVSMTRKGIACQKWSDQYPHVPSKIKHNNRRHPHPPAGGELALELRSKKNRKKEASRKKERRIRPSTNPEADLVENYCRNPDRDRHGPWCYTMDPNTQFDYCAIMPCTGDREPPSTVEAENVTFDSCGKRDDRTQRKARIVGGLPGNSPWTVSLRNRNGEHFCGGSLVQENWVISTRQCFSSCEADLSGYEVWLGTLFKNPGKDDPDRQAIGISTIMCGPTESHLVMLKLETPAVLNSRVAIICLPPARYIVPQDTECEIAGWGETKGTGHADVLKVAKFQVMNTHDCNIAHKGKVKDNEMCTKPMPIEVGACEGDYGGPLACLTHDCYVLEGVIIPGRGCGKRGQPAIFIRASLYVDWINKVMNMI